MQNEDKIVSVVSAVKKPTKKGKQSGLKRIIKVEDNKSVENEGIVHDNIAVPVKKVTNSKTPFKKATITKVSTSNIPIKSSLPFGLKSLKAKNLGKGIDPLTDQVVIHKCDVTLPNPFKDYINSEFISQNTKEIIVRERMTTCYNYSPVPVVISEGKGCLVKDVEGKVYIDFLSAYSAVNQGHGNTFIIKALQEQLNKIYITSRAFYNEYIYKTAETITSLFKYDKVLFMNGGVEAVESAIKIARKWGYVKKGIKDDSARIVFATGNFHGRTIAVCGKLINNF